MDYWPNGLDPDTVCTVSPQGIHLLWKERSQVFGKQTDRMNRVAAAYTNDIKLAVTNLYQGAEEPAVVNLIYQGINGMGMRTASPDPVIRTYPTNPGSEEEQEKAADRRRAFYGMWEANDHYSLRLQRALWYYGFANAPVTLYPSKTMGGPKWTVRDPRFFFPSDPTMVPANYIVESAETYGNLKRRYGVDVFKGLNKQLPSGGEWKDSTLVSVLEYCDSKCVMIFALSQKAETPGVVAANAPSMGNNKPDQICMLDFYPNMAGIPMAVNPSMITLDPNMPRSQFDGMLGSFQMRSRLMALSYIATFKGVLQGYWLEGREDEEPIVHTTPDPTTGEIGKTSGGKLIPEVTNPQYSQGQLLSILEGQERQSGSVPAEMGGVSPTNIRTGKRGGQVFGNAVDFYIEAAQLAFARSGKHENKIAVAIDKGWFGSTKKTFWVEWTGAAGHIEYTPNKLWTTDQNEVVYPFAGVDLSNQTLEMAQMIGLEAYSRRSFMENHPLVRDVELEEMRIQSEAIDRAGFASIQTLAADPTGPYKPTEIARMKELINEGLPWEKAVMKVDEEIAEKQSEETQGMVDPMSPEAMPGLDGAATGGPIAPPAETIPGAMQLGQTLLATRAPRMTVGNEAPA